MNIPAKIKIDTNIETVVFVGAGGTGGYIIPAAMHVLNSLPIVKKELINIYIVDMDVVEEKNILRQNFTYADIGKYKAEVMAQRYGALYNLNVYYVTKPLDAEMLCGLPLGDRGLIIDAVDNVRTRKIIYDYCKDGNNGNIWISSGNSDKEGQITIYSPIRKLKRSVVDLWPGQFTAKAIKEEIATEERANCALNAVVNPQSVAINRTAGNIVSNILFQIFFDHEINYDVVMFDRYNTITKYNLNQPVFGATQEQRSLLVEKFSQLSMAASK